MNSDKINIKGNKNNYREDEVNRSGEQLLNILTNSNVYNNKKAKFINKNDYEFIIRIFQDSEEKEFFYFYKYLNITNIPILKILINGFIEFDIETDIKEKIILNIISKGIYINFNKNLFFFIYKKLSKHFRRHNLLKDAHSVKKFAKLFEVWKLLYSTENQMHINDLIYHECEFLFFQNLDEEKKFVEIDIEDKNEMKYLEISIKFICSEILNINKSNKKFGFIKLFDNKKEILELTYNDLNLENEENKLSFSNIFKIKYNFTKEGLNIYINKKINISKKIINFDFNSIKKVIILNNFYGQIISTTFKKYYSTFADYSEYCPNIAPLKIKVKNIDNKIEIKTSAYPTFSDKNEKSIESGKLYHYQYCGASLSLKINYEKKEINNIWKKANIDLSELEFLEGLNCFIPIFKIIKYIINNLEFIIDNKNCQDEKEKISEINKYIDRIFIWIKDILKIILKMICLSENNLKNFKKIIVPLIGSLAEIVNSLNSSKLISNEKISILLNDEIFNSLYILLLFFNFPFNIKEMFRKLVGINKNLDNLKISMESLIIDIEKNHIKNLEWYFIILVVYIQFILIYYNSSKKVPYILKEQISVFQTKNINKENKDFVEKQEAINILIKVMKSIYNEEEEKNKETNIIESKNFLNDNNYYFQFIIYMITSFLNIKLILKKNKIEYEENCFYKKFLSFFESYFKKKDKINITNDYAQMIINFRYHPEEITFLRKLFPFLNRSNFKSENELIMDELIDYHGEYHHLMKELFIFNKLWSDKKLFFNTNLENFKKSNLKVKNINYYTRNFQRPILYPFLDYKYQYPDFSAFKIDKDFYLIKENDDDYNFDLDCSEFDSFINEYNKIIKDKIEKDGKINICEVCLIKQTHHVKGNLYIFYDDGEITIYFFSHSNKVQNNEEEFLCCNKKFSKENVRKKIVDQDLINSQLCYGSIFKCPKKDANKKIKIESDDIRLVLSRIYFYRNSALEIFTETKSYFFNFIMQNKKEDIILSLVYPFEKSFCPINIDGHIMGYIKINKKIINKNLFSEMMDKSNNFFNFFIDQISKGIFYEISNFDLLMIINLISNRSFNDLYQYPIFPILYFFDKASNKNIKRDFREHIGFQNNLQQSKFRKDQILKAYKESFNELNENNTYFDSEKKEDSVYYFNTHYSNSIYTSNFLIRFFPLSFTAIELQGKGFDNPNRLFFSIEDTLFNISSQKSDLRELIPEFFYLPEMFMNINCINFHKRNDDELVDDVIMPNNLNYKFKNLKDKLNSKKDKDKDKDDFTLMTPEEIKQKKDNYYNFKKCFIFVDDMKNKLEHLSKELISWTNIIFGSNQKVSSKRENYFRDESFINLKNKYKKNYLNDTIIMGSVEFGIIPLQTVFDKNILLNLFKKKSYEQEKNKNKLIKALNENQNIYKNWNKDVVEEENNEQKSNNIVLNDYWNEYLTIDFKINNNNSFGKLEIYKNDNLICEKIDHNDIIIDFFFNRRLNMFATTSYDGFVCIYVWPNKLFSMIKHHNNSYYDKVFLSSNPFPTIIVFEKDNNLFTSFSLTGMIIKKVKIEIMSEDKNSEIQIEPLFDVYGGTSIDKLEIIIKSNKKVINRFYSLPFFELESKEVI